MHHFSLKNSKQRGFGLVEAMVAMALSLFLTFGVLQIFQSSLQSARTQDALSRIQENGRFALETLARDLRMAGYIGCEAIDDLTPVSKAVTATPVNVTAATALFGMERPSVGAWSPVADIYAGTTLPVTFYTDLANARLGSDVVVVQRMQNPFSLSANMGATNNALSVNTTGAGFQNDQIVMVTDCETSDIFRATGVSAASIGHAATANGQNKNTSDDLSKVYGTDAQVMQLVQNAYFVQDTGRNNAEGENIFALFRRDFNGNVIELFEGVEFLQMTYGEDTDADGVANRYVPANAGGLNFANVVSVRVGMLMASNESVSSVQDNRSYDVAGTSIGVNSSGQVAVHQSDRRLRKTYGTTFRLRNRGL